MLTDTDDYVLTIIDSIKFHSSDYLDALEMDMEPQEGSQYWVCPVIVEYMNDRFDRELLRYIQDNEGHGIQMFWKTLKIQSLIMEHFFILINGHRMLYLQ